MKTISISVERNFHIKDDDRFLMEKISMTVELDKNDKEVDAIDCCRQTIVGAFKLAYPHLKTYLNFDEVVQVSNDGITPEHFIPSKSIDTSIPLKTFNLKDVPEKINKGTIEEQIEACTSLDELKTFKYVAEMNSKLNLLFHGKENELSLKKML